MKLLKDRCAVLMVWYSENKACSSILDLFALYDPIWMILMIFVICHKLWHIKDAHTHTHAHTVPVDGADV